MEKSLFWDSKTVDGVLDRTYNADDFADMFNGFWGEGVISNRDNALWVEALENSMSVIVNIGDAFVQGRFYQNTEDLKLILDIASDVDRTDLIALRCDKVARKIFVRVLKGADGMGEPTYARTDSYYDLILAKVHIKANAKYLTDDDIEDMRGTALCPWVNLRWTIDNLQESFADWYESIRNLIDDELAVKLQEQVDKNKADIEAANVELEKAKADLATANKELAEAKTKINELERDSGRYIVQKGASIYLRPLAYNPDIDTDLP